MKKRLTYHPLVPIQLESAVAWYEEQVPGLGHDLISEFDVLLSHILIYPNSFSICFKNFRQASLKRFPYIVLYEEKDDSLYIYNFIHAKQHPGKRKRL